MILISSLLQKRGVMYTVLFSIAFIIIGISGSIMGTALTYLSERFGLPVDDSGLLVALHTIGAMTATYIGGRLLDRLNSRALCWVGPGLLALGALVLHIPAAPWLAFVAIFLLGLGFGTVLITANVLVARLNPQNPALQLNLLNVFFGIGGILGPQVSNFALAQGNIIIAYSVLIAASLLLLPFMLRIDIAPPRQASAAERAVLAPLVLLPYILLIFFYTGTEIGFGSWLYTQLRQVTLLDVAEATAGVSLFWLGLTLGRVIGTVLARTLEDMHLLIGTTLVLIAGVAGVIVFGQAHIPSIAAAFLVGVGAGPVFPTTVAVINTRFASAGGTASGLILTIGNIGAAVVPWIQGEIGRGESGAMGVTLLCTLIVLALAVMLRVNRLEITGLRTE